LFLIPGLDHDFRNPQLRPINHFDALIDWVEQNQAPEKIKVEHQNKEGKITRTAFYDFQK
jgi:hypothetical protein